VGAAPQGARGNAAIGKDLRERLILAHLVTEALGENLGEIGSIHGSSEGGSRPEIAAPVGHRRHTYIAGLYALNVPLALVVGEEGYLVLADRTAEDATILILVKGCALRREVVPRIEIAVAEELEKVAMKGVRSCLGHTLMMPPVKLPYSASTLLDRMRNSAIESRLGITPACWPMVSCTLAPFR
jgi:hypothetical protein